MVARNNGRGVVVVAPDAEICDGDEVYVPTLVDAVN
jgi:hypothetical protein